MAETNGLLNRHTGITCIEGSNPSVSAKATFINYRNRQKRTLFVADLPFALRPTRHVSSGSCRPEKAIVAVPRHGSSRGMSELDGSQAIGFT